MKQIKNVTMTFYEFVPEHLELMNDKQIFAKLKNGDWELLYYIILEIMYFRALTLKLPGLLTILNTGHFYQTWRTKK